MTESPHVKDAEACGPVTDLGMAPGAESSEQAAIGVRQMDRDLGWTLGTEGISGAVIWLVLAILVLYPAGMFGVAYGAARLVEWWKLRRRT